VASPEATTPELSLLEQVARTPADEPNCVLCAQPLAVPGTTHCGSPLPMSLDTITVDGRSADWEMIGGSEATLAQALGDTAGLPITYSQGSITVKVSQITAQLHVLYVCTGCHVRN